jgi:hypothetical protein
MWPTFYIMRRRGRYRFPVTITTVYTTPPYPLEVEESIQSSTGTPTGYFVPEFGELDSMQSLWSVLSGTLRDILQSFSADPEAFNAGPWQVLGGELRMIYRSFEADPDEVQSGPWTPLSGELKRILITYEHPDPDSFESTWSVLSGTLS